MWYILMSATSLVRVIVFLADRSAIHHQPTYTLCGQTCQKYKQLSFKWPSLQHITSQLKKILIKVIHPNVSDLPGHLLQFVLAVHGVVDHQLTCTKCGQTCWQNKKLSSQPPSPQHITSLLKKISAEVIHPHVSKLPGLVLLVVLAVHSALNQQTTWAKTRQVGYP